eukprot:343972-Chlamydomonas_euryale.AAC.1
MDQTGSARSARSRSNVLFPSSRPSAARRYAAVPFGRALAPTLPARAAAEVTPRSAAAGVAGQAADSRAAAVAADADATQERALSAGAIQTVGKSEVSNRLKHIDVRYHLIKDH